MSPLLSNIVLDELDEELERRGHTFVRYADDLQVYVSSRRAGRRVMAFFQDFVERKLRLKVNGEKSAVDKAWKREYLGFGFYCRRRDGQVRIRLAHKTLRRLKTKLRELTSRRWSIAMSRREELLNRYLRGWLGYFYIADVKGHLERILWKHWKRCGTRLRKLRGLGIKEGARKLAFSRKGHWALSNMPQLNIALDNQYWLNQGAYGSRAVQSRTLRGARGRRGDPISYSILDILYPRVYEVPLTYFSCQLWPQVHS